MIKYQESIDLQRTVADVFGYIIEARNIPEWVDAVIDAWQLSEGPVGVGTQLSEIVSLGLFNSKNRSQGNWQVIEFEQNRRITFETDTSWGHQRQSFTFNAADQGTRLQVNGLHRLQGPMRLAQPVMGFFIKKARRKQLQKLKQILEIDPRDS
jgi:hypothetical protein